MAKEATIKNIGSGYQSGATIDENFEAINDKLNNTISRDGSAPNNMEADLDLDGNDILNAGDVAASTITVGGVSFVPNNAATVPNWEGPWSTSTAYIVNDLVSEEGNSYICTEAHTSGTFSTDLAAGKWELFAQKGSAGAGTGDMLAANNLSDVSNTDTSLTNLGGGTVGIAIFKDTTAADVRAEIDAQQSSPILDDLSDLTQAENKIPYFDSATTAGTLDFLDEDDMASNSATAIPSQQSVKAYVDSSSAFVSPSYESTSATLSTNTLYTFTHGLGSTPTMVTFCFVCTTAERGWSVGDEVPFTLGTENYNANVGPAVAVNSTKIKVRTASNAIARVSGLDGSSRAYLTPGYWKIKVRAWV